MNRKLFYLKRLLGYCLGFVLFYEPFMLFSKLMESFFCGNRFYFHSYTLRPYSFSEYFYRRMAGKRSHIFVFLPAVGGDFLVVWPPFLRQAVSRRRFWRIFKQAAAG